MVQGSCVWDPLAVFFLFVLFCFPFCSSSPMSASVGRDGGGCSPYVPRSRSFFSLFLLYFLSLSLMRADLVVAGVGSRIINKYKYKLNNQYLIYFP